MNPKLSIIIPCFNCEKTLREAVTSCFVQGFQQNEFEIVMVDDGSSDGTLTLMNTIAAEYSNVQVLRHEQNRGGGAARNTAAEHSRADTLFCLDSDDILPPRTLLSMYDFLQKMHCDGVGIHYSINFRGTDLTDIDHITTMARPGEKINFLDLFQTEQNMCSLYQVFMLTKSAFNQAGGYPTDHGFDTQGFAWRFLAAGLDAYTCPNTYYLLRVHFHDSYYIREYNQGKINFNWQKILAEHLQLFDESTQIFITTFNCADFTKNIFSELQKKEPLLKTNYLELLGKKINKPESDTKHDQSIHRESLKGIYLRIKHKLLS